MGLYPSQDRFVAGVLVNASTGTPVILASRNISSITDLGVGLFDLNFATPLPNANYLTMQMGQPNAGKHISIMEDFNAPVRTVNTLRVRVIDPLGPAQQDPDRMSVTIFNCA